MIRRFNISSWAVKETTLTLYFIILVTLAGLYAFANLGRAEDPTFTIRIMTVSANWPGATVQEMRQQVADKLEKRIQEAPYINKVDSIIRPGSVNIQIQFEDHTPNEEVRNVFYEVRKRMQDEEKSLPTGVQGPFVNDDFSDVYFSLYALSAPDLEQYELIKPAENIRDRLLKETGIQKVNIIGERPHTVFLELSSSSLNDLGITAQQVFSALDSHNRLQPMGQIETQAASVYLRIDADFSQIEQLKNTPLSIEGKSFLLSDVATLKQGYQDPPTYLIRNHAEDALLIGAIMQPNYNGLKLGDQLEALESQLQAEIPLGMSLTKITNQKDAISLAIDQFQIKFLAALAVVMLVSFISLGFRAGMIVALAVPLTLAMTFFIMHLTGKNLDRITLGALILALGLLVDDAIIAIEMMLVKISEGLDKIKAASYAWTVTAIPMLVGTLITAAGFIPIGFANSMVGEYAGNLFWILAFSLVASWIVAVIFTPYLGTIFLKENPAGQIKSQPDLYSTPTYIKLQQLISWCVAHRKKVVLGTILLFALSVIGMAKLVEKQFFPSSDRPELLIDIYLPEGTSIKTTDKLTHKVEKMLIEQPEVKTLSSYIGQGAPRFFMALNPELPNSAFGKIVAVTHNKDARDQLQAKLQKMIDQGEFPQARVRVHPLLYGPPVIWPITFRVIGEDPNILRPIAEEVSQIIDQHPKTIGPHLEWGQKSPSIKLKINFARLEQLGLTPTDLQQQLQFLLTGVEVTQLRIQNRSVQLLARAGEEERLNLENLGSLLIKNRHGESLPLEHLAKLKVEYEEPMLRQRNRMPFIAVNSEVQPGVQPPDITMEIWPQLQQLNKTLPLGYTIQLGGSLEESGKAQASLRAGIPAMLLVMLTLIMLMMRSFSGLFMVFLTAPLGLIGAVAALLLFGQPFGFVATLGLIGLGGILMRNTLILVGQIRDNQRAGMTDYDSVINATVRRARPVVLTAITAVLAFIPLTSSTFWGPLAYVLIGGIAVGTLLTILFLPAVYTLWFRIHKPT